MELLLIITLVFVLTLCIKKQFQLIRNRLDALEGNLANKTAFAQKQVEPASTNIITEPISPRLEPSVVLEPIEVIKTEKPLWLSWLQDNWTIAAGTTFLAFGLITAAIYLALYMGAELRVGSLTLFGIACVLGGNKIKAHSKFSELSIWLIALGGSLFLGAAVGAGFLDSMRLTSHPTIQIMIVMAAMLLNMLLAYKSRFELSAYFSFLNIATLGYLIHGHLIMEAYENYVFCAAFLCGLVSVFDRSPIPPLLSLIWFTLFNFEWLHIFGKSSLPLIQIGSVLVLSLLNLGRYYVGVYKDRYLFAQSKEVLALHVISWLTVGLNLYPYKMGFAYTPYIIGFVSLLVAALAYWARRLNATDLFYSDWIASQALCAIAIMLWGQSYGDWLLPLLIIQGMTATFALRLMKEEPLLLKAIVAITLAMLFLYTIMLAHSPKSRIAFNSVNLSLLAILAFVFQSLAIRFKILNGITSGHLYFWIPLTLGLLFLRSQSAIEHHFILPFLAFFYMISLKKVAQNHILALIASALIVMKWGTNVFAADLTLTFFINHLVLVITPLIVLTFIGFDYDRLKFPKIYCILFVFHISISLYALMHPYSDLLPSLIMIGASYLLFEAHQKVSDKWKSLIYQMGLLTFASFLALHVYLNIQVQAQLFSLVDYSLVIALFGLVVGYLWLKTSTLKNGVLEGLLGLSLLTIFMEVSYPWQPLAYAGLGLLMLKLELTHRSTWYRFFLLVGGCILVSGINKLYQSPNTAWYAQSEIPSILGLLALSAFALQNVLTAAPEKLRKYYKEWNVLPIYFSALIFLYARLDLAMLSLSWIVCASLLTTAAFYLKSKQLLNISYVTIIVCLVRISIFDLSQEVIYKRAIVLTAVGLLLIGIHMIYKRFSSRLSL